MNELVRSPLFPPHLEPSLARSLSIQFLLQAALDFFDLLRAPQKRKIGVSALCFYSEILVEASLIKESDLQAVLQEMKRGEVDFSKFFKALCPYLREAQFDENVLVYLIEQKERLNAHLGPRFVEELLQSFFPTGPAELRATIYEGYTRRGFSTFLSSVEPLLDAIEWEAPCASPAKG